VPLKRPAEVNLAQPDVSTAGEVMLAFCVPPALRATSLVNKVLPSLRYSSILTVIALVDGL
jgi:hypothetical protein